MPGKFGMAKILVCRSWPLGINLAIYDSRKRIPDQVDESLEDPTRLRKIQSLYLLVSPSFKTDSLSISRRQNNRREFPWDKDDCAIHGVLGLKTTEFNIGIAF